MAIKKMHMLSAAAAAATLPMLASSAHAIEKSKDALRQAAAQTSRLTSVQKMVGVNQKYTGASTAEDSLTGASYSNYDFLNYNFSVLVGDTTTVGSNSITAMLADDIVPATTSTFNEVSFSLSNFNATGTQVVRPLYRIYDSNGTNSGPGTLIATYDLPSTAIDAGYVYKIDSYVTNAPTLTAGHTYWTGVAFDNQGGATGASVDQLNNIGQDVFDPPSIGSSADKFFYTGTLTTGTSSIAGSSPTGSVITAPFPADPDTGDDAVNANFGRQIRLAVAQTPSAWNVDANGSWGTAGSWTNGVPNADTATALFGTKITAPRTVNVNAGGDYQVGTLSFTSPISYTLSGTGIIDVFGNKPVISVTAGTHQIDAELDVFSDTTITIAAGSKLTSTNFGFTGANFVKEGGGVFAVNNLGSNVTTINAGTFQILQNGDVAGSSIIGTLTIAGGATPTAALDLVDNDLDVYETDAGGFAKVQGYVKYARNGGLWNRGGITTSAAQPNGAVISSKGLGVLTGAEYLSVSAANTEFTGIAVDATDTLVKYTYNGDADFSGKINADDYGHIDGGYQNQNSAGAVIDWFHGDFDYSGKIDANDYALIDSAYQQQSGTLREALNALETGVMPTGDLPESLQEVIAHYEEFGTPYANAFVNISVPEPTTISLAGLATAGLLARRRRAR